jgi:hypothetical protein
VNSGDQLPPGLRDELITADLTSALGLLASDRVDVTRLERSEAVERLGKHLLPVARRLRTPASEDDVS